MGRSKKANLDKTEGMISVTNSGCGASAMKVVISSVPSMLRPFNARPFNAETPNCRQSGPI
jgi:hypothetical protein